MAPEDFLRILAAFMPVAMLGWLGAGVLVILWNHWLVYQDALDLAVVKDFVKDARGSNYEQKIQIRLELFNWAQSKPTAPIARWIFTAHNAALAGAMPDAAALTDAIWSHERERFQWFRFFSRYAILLGLFFTSVGLCITLFDIRPALTASGLSEAEWLKGVKAAMALALGGMAVAFFSSLLGIFITLVLQFVNLVAFSRYHERHVINLDAYVQGSLIPVFSALVEKDRNDVIVHAMNRAEEMFKATCEQTIEVRQQYERLFTQTGEYAGHLKDLRDTLARALHGLTGQIESLGGQIERLDGVSGRLSQAAESMGGAIEHGLEQIEVTQRKVAEHVSIQQAESVKIVASLERTRERLDEEARASASASKRLGMATAEFERLRNAVGENAGELRSLAEAQREVNQAWEGLHRSLSINEDQLRDELERRRNALEGLVGQMGKEVATGVNGPVKRVLSDHLQHFNELVGQRMDAQIEQQNDFNKSMDKKWDQLMTALGAYGDVRA